jgi:hypothetical protein
MKSHLNGPRLHFVFGLTPVLLCVGLSGGLLSSAVSCGKKDSSSEESGAEPNPTKTPIKGATATIPPTPVVDSGSVEFYVGSSALRTFVRFDSKGGFKNPWIDLKSSFGNDGGITAYASFNDANKIVAFDQGLTTKSESLALLDPIAGTVKNKNWIVDSALTQVNFSGLVTGFIANTLLVGTSDKILRILYDGNFSSAASTSEFLTGSTLAGCPHTAIENLNLVKKDDAKTLVLLSSGANTKINLIGLSAGAPTCAASFDYATAGQPTTSADVPISSVLMGDGLLYVLFQNATASKIVKYTYTASSLANPVVVFSDQTLLGAKPRALFGRSSLRLLFANTVDDKIYEISTAGVFSGFFLDNSFTQDVSLIVAP